MHLELLLLLRRVLAASMGVVRQLTCHSCARSLSERLHLSRCWCVSGARAIFSEGEAFRAPCSAQRLHLPLLSAHRWLIHALLCPDCHNVKYIYINHR